MIKQLLTLTFVLGLNFHAQAIISEQVDNLQKSSCFGPRLKMEINETQVTATAKDRHGNPMQLSGELESFQLDTEDLSLRYLIILEANEPSFRYLRVKVSGESGQASLLLSLNGIGHKLGDVFCDLQWKTKN